MVVSEKELDQLVRENRRLVESRVNCYLSKYTVRGLERADLVAWGMIGLLNAIRAFDPARGYKLCTLATVAIDNMITRGANKDNRYYANGGPLSLDYFPDPDDPDAGALFDQAASLVSSESQALICLEAETIRGVASLLPPLDYFVYCTVVEDEYNCKAVGDVLGMRRQSVHGKAQRVKRKLRRSLEQSK